MNIGLDRLTHHAQSPAGSLGHAANPTPAERAADSCIGEPRRIPAPLPGMSSLSAG
jgi:hypothetical protein